MKFSIGDVISGLIVAAIIGLGYYLMPILPATLATHWGADGIANGWMSKDSFILFMSALSVILWVIFTFLPRLDPLQKNVSAFSGTWDYFKVTLFLFLAYMYALSLQYNLLGPFNLVQYMVPGFALLLFSIGLLLSKAKQNWFIGIRTPWTLSNERVWNQTHAVAGQLFKISALIAMIGIFFPTHTIWFIIFPVLLASLFSLVYSYYLFTTEKATPNPKLQPRQKTVRKKKRKNKKKGNK